MSLFRQEILIESGTVGQGSINGIMSGKFYNGSVRCHKLMHESLEIIRFQAFVQTLSDERQKEIEVFLSNARDSFEADAFPDYIESPDLETLMHDYNTFVEQSSELCPTFALWSSYLDITGMSL